MCLLLIIYANCEHTFIRTNRDLLRHTVLPDDICAFIIKGIRANILMMKRFLCEMAHLSHYLRNGAVDKTYACVIFLIYNIIQTTFSLISLYVYPYLRIMFCTRSILNEAPHIYIYIALLSIIQMLYLAKEDVTHCVWHQPLFLPNILHRYIIYGARR